MPKITKLENLYREYKLWTVHLKKTTQNIEDTILQKSSPNKIEERLVSIAISLVFMFIVTNILGFFLGAAMDSVFISIFFFFIGLALSKLINKKLYGQERSYEELSEEESMLIVALTSTLNKQIQLRDRLNDKELTLFFCDYTKYNKEFDTTLQILKEYNAATLAFKFRTKLKILKLAYKKQLETFHKIYANKG